MVAPVTLEVRIATIRVRVRENHEGDVMTPRLEGHPVYPERFFKEPGWYRVIVGLKVSRKGRFYWRAAEAKGPFSSAEEAEESLRY